MTEDEYLLDTPVVRAFVADVRAAIAAADGQGARRAAAAAPVTP